MQNKSKIFWLVGLFVAAITFVGAGCSITNKSNETKSTETPKVVEKTEVSLDKTSYTAGKEIVVTYNIVEDLGEKAWVGIIPSDVTHDSENEADANDTTYAYLEGSKKGTKTLTAPLEAGSYDARIYSDDKSNAKELGSVSFTVVVAKTGDLSLELDNTEYAPGASIKVTFSGAADLGNEAWVGVIKSDVQHGLEATNDENDTSYVYLDGKASGTVTLTAPLEAGSYDVRLNEADTTGAKELTYVSFTVKK